MNDNYKYQEGIHVLKLSGDDYQMGFEHGRLLKAQIQEGVVPYFSKFVKNSVSDSVGKLPAKVLSAVTNWLSFKKALQEFSKNMFWMAF